MAGSKLVVIQEKIEGFCLFLIKTFYKWINRELDEKKSALYLQIIRYLFVGVSNMLLSYLVYALFLLLGCSYTVSNLLSFCFSVLNSYFCSQKFVFHGNNKWYRMLAKVALSYVGTGLILQEILLFGWVDVLGVSPFIAPFLNIAIITPINFLIQKFWAYR